MCEAIACPGESFDAMERRRNLSLKKMQLTGARPHGWARTLARAAGPACVARRLVLRPAGLGREQARGGRMGRSAKRARSDGVAGHADSATQPAQPAIKGLVLALAARGSAQVKSARRCSQDPEPLPLQIRSGRAPSFSAAAGRRCSAVPRRMARRRPTILRELTT